jgi:hypothetical protein
MHMTSHVVLSDGKLGECLSIEPQSKLAKKGGEKNNSLIQRHPDEAQRRCHQ